MGLFGGQQSSYLGIDLGSGNIKMIELVNVGGKPKLYTYGCVEIPIDDVSEKILKTPLRAAAILKKIIKESKARSSSVVASLPVSTVFSTIINLPKVSKKELASSKNLAPIIHWEAKKLIPLPLEEMVLDWQVLPTAPVDPQVQVQEVSHGENKDLVRNTRVLLTAASKEVVSKYIEVFKLAGLQLMNLETDIFALVRSLIGRDKSTIMIIDIGAKTTNLSIVDNAIPYLNKSINLGGLSFSQAIAEKLSVDTDQAEQFKKDLSFGDKKVFPEVLKQRLVDLENEINYSVNLFSSSHPEKLIEKIILTGGSSLIPLLDKHLSQSLDLRVYIGDPWARVIYPEDLRPILDEIGPKFSVAIGLAMRNIMQ